MQGLGVGWLSVPWAVQTLQMEASDSRAAPVSPPHGLRTISPSAPAAPLHPHAAISGGMRNPSPTACVGPNPAIHPADVL